jgi:phosphate transport system substrate-binding protein
MNTRRVSGFSILILLCSLVTAPFSSAGEAVRLKGSGASFPFPLYGRWFKEYGKAHRNVIINYQAKGSGAGIRDFMNKTVDFAASDAAMSDKEMAQVGRGVQLVPVVAGSIILAYNFDGFGGELKLTRDVYVDIFEGKIKTWSDPRIKQTNPDLKLPKDDLVIAVRQDSSGTTYAFTNHLSALCS